MARKAKEGIDYFPMDVDVYTDDKMKLLRARFGIKGYAIYTLLLAKIYKDNGYWMKWGEDEALLFANDVGGDCQHSFVNDVVHESVKRGLFDTGIFNQFQILTSKGIQERYTRAVESAKLKRDSIDPKLDLRNISKLRKIIHSEFFEKSSEEIAKTSEEIEKNSEESTQRKGKEIKGKERELKLHQSFAEKLFKPESQYDLEMIEVQVRHKGVKPEWAERFNATLYTGNREHINYKDWCGHFANWLVRKLPEFVKEAALATARPGSIKKEKW